MNNDGFDMYIARTQARLAFFLIIILVLLSIVVMLILVLPQMKPQQEIIGNCEERAFQRGEER